MKVNEDTFRRWWEIFHATEDARLCELRLFRKANDRRVASGYFGDVEFALNAVKQYPYEVGLYAPINVIAPACYSRTQRDVILENVSTTGDNDIIRRRWILIDLDPDRPSDTNATDTELHTAYECMQSIGRYLREQGFADPVLAMSGNGYHLYYKVDMPNDKDTTKLVDNLLKVLDMQFSTPQCHVDLQVGNASRIAKVIGSWSSKGSNTPERPQRESYFRFVPPTIGMTSKETIQAVVTRLMPEEEPKYTGRNYTGQSFSLSDFISKHGIKVARIVQGNVTKYILDECPFCSNHRAPDSAIFEFPNGYGFKCLHNSCSGKQWRDVRALFEPDYLRTDHYRPYYTNSAPAGEKPETPRPDPSLIEQVKRSMTAYDINTLVVEMVQLFPASQVITAISRYYVGTCLDGTPMYWYIDYGSSIHPTRSGCLFGEHLLRTNFGKVAIVEHERTAVMMSCAFPQVVWLAVGGGGNITSESLRMLGGREVTIFPSAGCDELFATLTANLKRVAGKVDVSPIMRTAKLGQNDLADIMLESVGNPHIKRDIENGELSWDFYLFGKK